MDSSLLNKKIYYNAIQLEYRKIMIDHIRKRMSVSFPEDGLHRIKQLFEDGEWKEMVKSENVLRTSAQSNIPIRDDYDYLDVNHFCNIFDKYFEVLIDVSDLAEDQLNEEKKTVLTWIHSIKSTPDPISHPSDQELSRDDAFSMIECAHKVVTKFDLKAALDVIWFKVQLAISRLSNNALYYKVIHLEYRNIVIDHIRQRMSTSFPEDYTKKIKQLFTDEEWTEIVKSKNTYQITDNDNTQIKDELDYLDVSHFYNIFDKYYDMLIDVTDLTEDQLKVEKKATLAWMQSIKDIRVPSLCPSDEELSLSEASAMIDCAQKVVTKFDLRAALDILEYLPQLKLRMSCN